MNHGRISEYYDDPCHCTSYKFIQCFYCKKKVCSHFNANFCEDCYQLKKNEFRRNKYGKYLDPKTNQPLKTCVCGEFMNYAPTPCHYGWSEHRPLFYGERIAQYKKNKN